jgi:hypothetical protein
MYIELCVSGFSVIPLPVPIREDGKTMKRPLICQRRTMSSFIANIITCVDNTDAQEKALVRHSMHEIPLFLAEQGRLSHLWRNRTRLIRVGRSPKARFHPFPNSIANHLSGERFQFISIQNPNDAKDRTTRRLARSHAVARGLEKKRRRLQQLGHNFYTVSLKDDPASKSKETNHDAIVSSISLSIVASGPFQSLAAESPRLQSLLSQRKVLSQRSRIQH